LQSGDYLEVFYGGAPDDGPVIAISARLLPPADLAIFNGILKEITLEEGQSREGSMLLTAIDRHSEHYFRFSSEFTQFYLDFDSLQPDDRLNIFYNGVSTRTAIPQSSALEIRPYAE
jgi:hypothetical protein